MPISKRQQAAFDAKLEQALTMAALRWTSPCGPDVPPPTDFSSLSKGFLLSGGIDNPYVEIACSTSGFHASGRNDRTSSQGARWLFSTRLLALKYARHEAEVEFAKRLRRIDKLIEQEQALAAQEKGGQS